jgi:restriction system protein
MSSKQPLPTYDEFIEPVLRYLAAYPEGAEANVVYEAAAVAHGLTAEDRREVLSSGKLTYKARILWAHDRLKRAGLSEAPRRGVWRLTQAGLDFAHAHPGPLSDDLVQRLATRSDGSRLRAAQLRKRPDAGPPRAASPNEAERLLLGQRTRVAREALEFAHHASGARFRTLVCALLKAEGYGDPIPLDQAADLVDGLLVLSVGARHPGACVLAKQLTQPLAESRAKELLQSMVTHGLTSGVFVSTSTFSQGARKFARSVPALRLIDGPQLAELMLVRRVGTVVRIVEVPEVNVDYFRASEPQD